MFHLPKLPSFPLFLQKIQVLQYVRLPPASVITTPFTPPCTLFLHLVLEIWSKDFTAAVHGDFQRNAADFDLLVQEPSKKASDPHLG
ncbi:hypothetical protein ACFX12_014646 [Malus domestica]